MKIGSLPCGRRSRNGICWLHRPSWPRWGPTWTSGATAQIGHLAGWQLFAGRAGIRGTLPAGLNPGGIFYRQLLDVLRKHVAAWTRIDSPHMQLRSVFVMASSAEGEREVQAAVDGFLQQSLVTELSELPWPGTAEAYLFKQLLVLRRGEP